MLKRSVLKLQQAVRGRLGYGRLAYILVPTLMIAMLGLGGSAQAATHTAKVTSAVACHSQNGTSSDLHVTHKGPAPYGGTIFVKPTHTGCSDLNIIYVNATDRYEGWLFNTKSGTWSPCKPGFIRITRGHHKPIVLCHIVKATTQMAVVQASSHHRKITVLD